MKTQFRQYLPNLIGWSKSNLILSRFLCFYYYLILKVKALHFFEKSEAASQYNTPED